MKTTALALLLLGAGIASSLQAASNGMREDSGPCYECSGGGVYGPGGCASVLFEWGTLRFGNRVCSQTYENGERIACETSGQVCAVGWIVSVDGTQAAPIGTDLLATTSSNVTSCTGAVLAWSPAVQARDDLGLLVI